MSRRTYAFPEDGPACTPSNPCGNCDLCADNGESWPAPTPLGAARGLPVFPVTAFPGWVRDHVIAVAEFTQTPVDLPACVALAALATAVGGRVKVQVRGPWVEATNLFTVTALPPGSRKSAVFSAMTKPLLLAETALVEKVEPKILEVETMIKITEAELKRAREGAAKAETTKMREEKRDEAMTLGEVLAQLVEEEMPPRPRLVADDITPEACASLLAEQDGRLGVLSAEGGIFSILAGRYSQGVPSLDIFLKGHAGDMLRVDRKGRPPEIINSPALSLGLTVQPDVLKAIANLPGFRGRGLLARILYSLPENTVGWRKVGVSPPVDEVANRFEVFLCDLAKVFYDWKDPAALTLSLGAAGLLLDEERALEPRLRPHEDLGYVTDWASKLIGTMARIAGLLHVAEHQGSVSDPIDETTMGSAIRIGRYFTIHALAAFDLMGADPTIEDARYILDWIRRTRVEWFSRRDAHRGCQRFKKAGDLAAPLDLLEDHGYISRRPDPDRTGGRPPAPNYDVNPLIFDT